MRVQSISSHSQIFSAQLNLNIYGNEKSINRAGKIWFRNVLESVISVSNARKDYFVKNKIPREFRGLEGIRRKQIIFHIQRKIVILFAHKYYMNEGSEIFMPIEKFFIIESQLCTKKYFNILLLNKLCEQWPAFIEYYSKVATRNYIFFKSRVFYGTIFTNSTLN